MPVAGSTAAATTPSGWDQGRGRARDVPSGALFVERPLERGAQLGVESMLRAPAAAAREGYERRDGGGQRSEPGTSPAA